MDPPARPRRGDKGDENERVKPGADGHGQDESGSDEEKASREEDKKPEQPPKKPFWKRPVLLSIMVAVTLLIVIGAIVFWSIERNYASTDDAFIDGRIIHVAPRVSGRVLSLNVEDNQYVEAGTVVVNLDKAPFQAAYDNAKAAAEQDVAKVAQAQADEAVQQANAEQARADQLVAEANAENAARDYQRYVNVPAAARTQQEFDTAAARRKVTAAQVTEARKKAAAMDAQVVSAQTAIHAAQSQLAASQAQLQQQALYLRYADVTAGQSGFVSRRTVEVGNYVQTGQELLTLVSKDVWVTANFKETQLTYMQPNQPVEVKIDAYPQHKYAAHVDSVQAGTGAVFSVLPPENATGNFVKIVQRVPVKIRFDEALDHVMAPGESVEPTVDIRSGRR